MIKQFPLKKKKEVVNLLLFMKVYGGSRGIALLFLTSVLDGVVTFTLRPLYSREITPVPVE
jgi:hypothetical protein